MDVIQLGELIANASPVALFGLFIASLLKGWLVLPRELQARDKRIIELARERDEFKAMAYKTLNISERFVSVTEHSNGDGISK